MVTYLYENLTPETFQQFCQALLATVFPDVQCFPVAQPDGGRDALLLNQMYSLQGAAKGEGFNVFQVKFVRNPATEKEPHKWLVGVLQDEAPKLAKLIPDGAKNYYLLTNLTGTAHPGAGSIDQVQKLLTDNLTIPAMCWWRDDLDRRLDSSWALKWSYPSLMKGDDILITILQSGIAERASERQSAIRSYLADQYKDDEEVRFKQVELQNKLLDLFIDIPISMRSSSDEMIRTIAGADSLYDEARPVAISEVYVVSEGYVASTPSSRHRATRSKEGAATALLTARSHVLLRAVIEGAPGQGKSTISQYLCQVHRMRILNKSEDLSKISATHRESPLRIPFKVDLRDLALWFARRNPFSSGQALADGDQWVKSLESFLAAQVRHHSGGLDFSVGDLHAIAKVSAILIVLDGFDEVADIAARRIVVDEILKAVNRLETTTASLQVVITSRPAAFSNSPGFPEDVFSHFHLQAVTRNQIDEYAGKWMNARKLVGRSRVEFTSILSEKLSQPHLRDLARNPMQLAILLSLIHTRGSSLPDKRTALYDNYMELFFSRESEKSLVVREHRDLLINLHQYLGWRLHTDAELGSATLLGASRGSVTAAQLHQLVSEYLKREGHDPTIAEVLFTGMVERVVALVSRVEGTYEFEVQPLREYFAARFLYETAPYSPPGDERRGTKPERFDAIARNFYWLNVTRFLAGCFSKGELASLVDSLEVLADSDGYRLITYPRSLAVMLLTDWVFAQQPKSVAKVVSFILEDRNFRLLLAARTERVARILPERSGRNELIAQCFEIMKHSPPIDYLRAVLAMAEENCGKDQFLALIQRCASDATGTARTRCSDLDFGFVALLLFTWGRSKTLTSLSQELEFGLERMRRSEFANFIASVRDGIVFSRKGVPTKWLLEFDVNRLSNHLRPRMAAVLCRRARTESAIELFDTFLSGYAGTETPILALCQELSLDGAARDPKRWPEALKVVANSYAHGVVAPSARFNREERSKIPLKIAEKICSNPALYPLFLIRAADSVCTRTVGARMTPVSKIAETGGWLNG
jgi:hypothetical protein